MKRLILAGSALLLLVFAGCKKDNKEAIEELKVIAQDHAAMEGEFSSVFDFVDNTSNEDPLISGRMGSSGAAGLIPACATLSFDTSSKTLVIDFGTVNCLCKDGLYRRGKIIAVFDGFYRTAGAKATVTLDNYFLNDIQYTGTKVIENLGNASGNFRYSYTVSNASRIGPHATITWSTQAVLERVQGDNTLTPWDDIYLATGTSSGVASNGVSYTVTTDTPLMKKIQFGCLRNFVDGILRINTSNGNTLILDYDPIGGAPCDKIANVTINNLGPYTITLR